jgi:hypothetical protein
MAVLLRPDPGWNQAIRYIGETAARVNRICVAPFSGASERASLPAGGGAAHLAAVMAQRKTKSRGKVHRGAIRVRRNTAAYSAEARGHSREVMQAIQDAVRAGRKIRREIEKRITRKLRERARRRRR